MLLYTVKCHNKENLYSETFTSVPGRWFQKEMLVWDWLGDVELFDFNVQIQRLKSVNHGKAEGSGWNAYE